ncbi:MAG: phosphate acyltransferase PlsX [Bacteroidetes bacterium]|nr:phosphate acyltransferase PlsX [Bacteroidota bacterium]
MNLALDMMGGDYAPLEAVKGLKLFLQNSGDKATVFCIGDEQQIASLIHDQAVPTEHVKIIHTTEVIGYHEHPTKALKDKPDSSISRGFQLLASGKADAFLSAGNTGAMLVGSMFFLKPLEGVLRPTIATMIPKVGGSTSLLLDVGLNVDCKPQHLDQFAVLGSLYAKNILGINDAKVGLLNIGEEEGKGNALAKETYPLLKENRQINFMGNVEGRDIFNGGPDVTVCDGFTGNVVLKLGESFYDIVKSRNLHNDEFMQRFAYENYGGTPVLGVAKPVIIGHGISNDVAFCNMLTLAEKMIDTDVCGAIRSAFHGIVANE